MTKLAEIIKRHRWDIAFVDENWNFRFVQGLPRDRWFADPFILSVSDAEIVLLAEEFEYSVGKGRIARVIIDRETLRFKGFSIILELPSHLSFPFIFRHSDGVFICPENSASSSWTMYRYDDPSCSVSKMDVLIPEPLTDAVMYSTAERWLVFSTGLPSPNGNVLKVFEGPSYSGHFTLKSEICFDLNVARNAGEIFVSGNEVVRPAQICDGRYGYGLGISFQKIDVLPDGYYFTELFRKYPPRGYDGMHTFNSYGGFSVVDCRRNLYPCLRAVLHYIKHKFLKISSE